MKPFEKEKKNETTKLRSQKNSDKQMFSLESENEIKLRTIMLDLSTNDVI